MDASHFRSTNDKILEALEGQKGNADRLAAQTASLEIAVRDMTAEIGTLRRFLEGISPLLNTLAGVDAAARLAQEASASVSATDKGNEHLAEVRSLLERLASSSETVAQSVALPAAKELAAVRKLLESIQGEQSIGQTAALQSSERLSAVVAALVELRKAITEAPQPPDTSGQLERLHGEVVTLRRIGQELVKLLTPPEPEPSDDPQSPQSPPSDGKRGVFRRLFARSQPAES